MTRIIAGSAGGRRITVPRTATRPTSDRAREAMFSTIESLLGSLAGARVLDLYAGSGALAFEALSRGAAVAVCVESDPRAAAVIRRNAADLQLAGASVVGDHVERFVSQAPGEPFDVVVADPPYALHADALAGVLRALVSGGWLADGAVVVVERATRAAPLQWPPGIDALRERRYGEATLWYGRAGSLYGSSNGSLTGEGA